MDDILFDKKISACIRVYDENTEITKSSDILTLNDLINYYVLKVKETTEEIVYELKKIDLSKIVNENEFKILTKHEKNILYVFLEKHNKWDDVTTDLFILDNIKNEQLYHFVKYPNLLKRYKKKFKEMYLEDEYFINLIIDTSEQNVDEKLGIVFNTEINNDSIIIKIRYIIENINLVIDYNQLFKYEQFINILTSNKFTRNLDTKYHYLIQELKDNYVLVSNKISEKDKVFHSNKVENEPINYKENENEYNYRQLLKKLFTGQGTLQVTERHNFLSLAFKDSLPNDAYRYNRTNFHYSKIAFVELLEYFCNSELNMYNLVRYILRDIYDDIGFLIDDKLIYLSKCLGIINKKDVSDVYIDVKLITELVQDLYNYMYIYTSTGQYNKDLLETVDVPTIKFEDLNSFCNVSNVRLKKEFISEMSNKLNKVVSFNDEEVSIQTLQLRVKEDKLDFQEFINCLKNTGIEQEILDFASYIGFDFINGGEVSLNNLCINNELDTNTNISYLKILLSRGNAMSNNLFFTDEEINLLTYVYRSMVFQNCLDLRGKFAHKSYAKIDDDTRFLAYYTFLLFAYKINGEFRKLETLDFCSECNLTNNI